jgi:hypothetical protein
MTPRELLRLTKRNDELIGKITDLLAESNIPPPDAEALLLFMVGVSAGMRQASISGEWIHPVAMGWQVGASEDPDNDLPSPKQ